MVCTASLISVLVALGATWNTSVFWFSLIASPFSVITGRRMIWYALFITPPPPLVSAGPATALFHRLLCRFIFAAARLALLLRNRLLQRNLQLLDRRLREDHTIMPQKVI